MKRFIFALAALSLVLSGSVASADLFWGTGSVDWYYTGNRGAVIFQFDTTTGTVNKVYEYSQWKWLSAISVGPANSLYVAYNPFGSSHLIAGIARVDAATGNVLSTKPIKDLTGTDYPYWNSLHFLNGKLYGVENNGWGSGYTAGQQRGRIYEVTLDGAGNPVSATLGAFLGPVPDGALTYRHGVWYGSDWKTDASSNIKTGINAANTSEVFSTLGSTSGVGSISGWDFTSAGDLLAVSYKPKAADPTLDIYDVFKIDLPSGNATKLYNLNALNPGKFHSDIIWIGGLAAAPIPEPVFFQMGALLGLGGLSMLRLRRR